MNIRVERRHGEDDEKFAKRFKKACELEGIISEIKERSYHDKIAIRRKKDRRLKRRIAARNYRIEHGLIPDDE